MYGAVRHTGLQLMGCPQLPPTCQALGSEAERSSGGLATGGVW